ncbi:MAG: hypothetical protein GF399_02870 [Candidatus Coatesbacteria bacterium]|nr:hypothetical protein [Candidatus Coatesbacteria bacterium]
MATGISSSAVRRFLLLSVLLTASGCAVEHGPETTITVDDYAVATPHDAWERDTGSSALRLVRRERSGGGEVLGYLRVQPFGPYLDTEDEARKNGTVTAVLADLEGLLRREIEARTEVTQWSGAAWTWREPTLGVMLRFDDLQQQLHHAETAPCFNTAVLLLAGDGLHFVHGCGYLDETETLEGEIDTLLAGLTHAGRRLLPETE